jgi:aminoglycoside 6'-N-acetyltransferase I
MRLCLWPDESSRGHDTAIDEILDSQDAWGFVAVTAGGAPARFAGISIRKTANSCESRPVPFLEGIWVEPRCRRRGVAMRLIKYIEGFLRVRGFGEIGSGSLIDNQGAHRAHKAWEFSETERVVYFRKTL